MKSLLDLPRGGEQSLGVYISDLGVVATEIAGICGFDYMRVDYEHVMLNPQDLASIIRAASAADVPTLVRVSGFDEITKILDIGASGILMPGISSVEQARAAANACKYAPVGERGMAGASRAIGYGLGDMGEYFATANDRVAFCAQIESREGVENAEAIANLEGVDIVTTGPWDLAQDMGHIGNPGHPEVIEATEHVIKKTLDAGKIMLMSAATPEDATKLKSKGVLMATVCFDVIFFARAMRAHIEKFR